MAKTMLISPTLGNVTFDAVFHLQHGAEVALTEHPVQIGAPVSDHAYVKPKTLTMEVGMTDAIEGGAQGRSASAHQLFMELLALREPVKIVTRLRTYSNMLVTSVSASDDKSTMHGLRAVIGLKEVIMASVRTVSVQSKTSALKQNLLKPTGKAKPGKTSATVKKSVTTKTLSKSEQAKMNKLLGR